MNQGLQEGPENQSIRCRSGLQDMRVVRMNSKHSQQRQKLRQRSSKSQEAARIAADDSIVAALNQEISDRSTAVSDEETAGIAADDALRTDLIDVYIFVSLGSVFGIYLGQKISGFVK